MEVSRCPACGAPLPPNAFECAYCLSYLRQDSRKTEKNHDTDEVLFKEKAPTAVKESAAHITFHRVVEPNEQAFTVAVPQGWNLAGGIFRTDLTQQMVDAQNIEAKIDFTISSDAQASIAIRWCPTVKYCDVRMTPAAMLFPQGSNYSGMVVWPLMTPQDFILQNLYPWAHPQATQFQVLDKSYQPALAENYRNNMQRLGIPAQFASEGGNAIYCVP